MAVEKSDLSGFEQRKAQSRQRGKLRGLGIAYVIERAAAKGFEGAEIRFERDGSVTILSGSLSQGQGHETVFTQMVAGELGIPASQFRYIQGDTDKIMVGEGTGASRSATMSGNAFHIAGKKIIEKATLIAAHHLGVAVDDVVFNAGVFSSALTNKTATMQEIGGFAFNLNKLPGGLEPGLFAVSTFSVGVENFPNGCHVCEVEIDPATGRISVVRYTVVDDVGTVLNPLLVKGQIVGGVLQGVGQILMEDIQFDSDGQLVTGSFMD
jgi:carbon-monoxide dehydrogenase large subunit